MSDRVDFLRFNKTAPVSATPAGMLDLRYDPTVGSLVLKDEDGESLPLGGGGSISTPKTAYIETNGDDATGEWGNPEKPFATLAAAIDAFIAEGSPSMRKVAFGMGVFTEILSEAHSSMINWFLLTGPGSSFYWGDSCLHLSIGTDDAVGTSGESATSWYDPYIISDLSLNINLTVRYGSGAPNTGTGGGGHATNMMGGNVTKAKIVSIQFIMGNGGNAANGNGGSAGTFGLFQLYNCEGEFYTMTSQQVILPGTGGTGGGGGVDGPDSSSNSFSLYNCQFGYSDFNTTGITAVSIIDSKVGIVIGDGSFTFDNARFYATSITGSLTLLKPDRTTAATLNESTSSQWA